MRVQVLYDTEGNLIALSGTAVEEGQPGHRLIATDGHEVAEVEVPAGYVDSTLPDIFNQLRVEIHAGQPTLVARKPG
ncbi:hypothetical protein [Streptantibioticus ferralitis]|uniref:DUF2283 domain-containing protein n=1 Tax=Streptantibioticus ferralitis TaxID=236510 RepID=A0ABT5YU18_9ACTN|nr:hypothetical protein [Streptantibioticus ferralitis]MDF2254958.1 hypothetical protein [Streptantibioticus ferralitis]